jgi:hypothetical protein
VLVTTPHRSGLLTARPQDISEVVQVEHVVIRQQTDVRVLICLIRASRERGRDLGQCVRSIALDDRSGWLLHELSDQMTDLALMAPNVRSLDVATKCATGVSAVYLSAVARVAGATLTSLAVRIDEGSAPVYALKTIAEMRGLRRLHIVLDLWLSSWPFDDMPPLVLPHLHHFTLKWCGAPATSMLRWLVRAQIRRDCELHLMPTRMSSEELEALDPLLEVHGSQCIHIEKPSVRTCEQMPTRRHSQVPRVLTGAAIAIVLSIIIAQHARAWS